MAIKKKTQKTRTQMAYCILHMASTKEDKDGNASAISHWL